MSNFRNNLINTQHLHQPIAAVLTAILFLNIPSTHAAGFQISEQSVAGLGRAFAGSGISGESISDQFFNPAGLHLRSGTELEVGLHFLKTTAQFENQQSTVTIASASGANTLPASGGDSDGGGQAIIPNLYVAADINQNLRYGVGVTASFGLSTDYDSDWVGRYAALKSELTTVEITPSISYKFGNNSVGLGLVFLNAEAELSNAQFTGVNTADGIAKLQGDDSAVGYTLGIQGENDYGRIGFGFRSSLKIEVDGDLTITPLGITSGASTTIVLPATYYLSGLIKASPKLDIVAGIRLTDWDQFQELRISFDNGLPDAVTRHNWSDTIMTSVGVIFRKNRHWTWRGGVAYDQAAVRNVDRTARIPDADRFWLSFGGSYQSSDRVRMDFAYAHIFADDVALNETTNLVASSPGAVRGSLTGEYTDIDADIISVAVSVDF